MREVPVTQRKMKKIRTGYLSNAVKGPFPTITVGKGPFQANSEPLLS